LAVPAGSASTATEDIRSGNPALDNQRRGALEPHGANIAAFIGACIGFLWYNAFPAQVFMGDTGSLAIGGIIAVYAIAIRKELLIPILCGLFFVESLSVILQVGYFKLQKRRKGLEYASANRLFKMAPLHHHYQKSGFHESKIVMRFFIIGIMLAVLTFVTLKLR
jgi:phospho-N-acetylmuramoyl-pentapeptide-transferase